MQRMLCIILETCAQHMPASTRLQLLSILQVSHAEQPGNTQLACMAPVASMTRKLLVSALHFSESSAVQLTGASYPPDPANSFSQASIWDFGRSHIVDLACFHKPKLEAFTPVTGA